MTDYIYATACIRSMEDKLIKEEQFGQLVEMNNADDIFKILENAGYGGEDGHFDIDNYEKKLGEKSKYLVNYIKELSDDEVFDIFSIPSDYHNIKVILKGEALGIKRPDILLNTGTILPSEMVRYVNERDEINLTENMLKAVNDAIDNHARTKDPQIIDLVCDKYCYIEISEIAKRSGNDFIENYISLLIDTLNFKTCMRARMMGKEWPFFSELYIPNGNIDEKVFIDSFDDDLTQIAERFSPYEIYEVALKGLARLDNTGSFTLLEKLCDDVLIKYIRKAGFKTFGIEALFAYMVSAQMEIKSVRILITGKLAGMEPALIKERLRLAYE